MKPLWVFLSVGLPLTATAAPFEIEYANPADIPYVCTRYSNTYDPGVGGCYIPWLRRMVIPPAGYPLGGKYGCIYWHEYRHMIQGDWHKGPSSDCSWRPTPK